MVWQAWLALAIVVLAMAILATDRFPTSAVLGAALLVILVSGAADSSTVLSGLSSPATVTIGALYVVAAAISFTGAMSWLLDRMLFGRTGRLAQLALAVGALSAFVPNTPLVAMAAPRVMRFSRRHDTQPARYLMPLSFATILGGIVTLMGTSTNLVIADGLVSAGQAPLGVFEMSPVTVPIALAGLATLVLTAPRLLGGRGSAASRRSARQFESQMVVEAGGPLVGKTVHDGGLRDLDGLYLAAIDHDGRTSAASANSVLHGGDHLFFVGEVEHLVDLDEVPGLASAEERHVLDTEGPGVGLYEAVISGRSDLAGQTLKESRFRARYGAAVLAVERSAHGIHGKLGSVPMLAGDVLVVLAGPDFAQRWRDHGDFSLVAALSETPPRRRTRSPVALVALVMMVLFAATGVTSLLVASLLAATFVVLGGALSMSEARHAIDFNVVLTVAASIGLGASVASTGLADEIATTIVSAAGGFGMIGVLLATIVATQVLTELLSNSGAAALMLPVAFAAAGATGGNPRAFAIGVLVGASCSFLTPVGYQTNLMVYGLGGYRFSDFTKVGFPLTIVVAVVATAMLNLVY